MTDTDQTEDDPMRAFAKALFAPDPDEPDPDEQQKPPDPRLANFVQTEGSNPTGEAHDMRAYVKALFYPDPPDA